ncbi:hypothetical protein HN827_09570 [archaeon]|nr:hypothetical protein [archaeon]
MNKRTKYLVLVSIFFAILIIPTVFAQSINFIRALSPLQNFNGQIYEVYYPLIDFILVGMIFVGLARSSLGKQFKAGPQALTGIGLLMAAIVAMFEWRFKISLFELLWPLVVMAVILMVVRVVMYLAKGERLWSGIMLLIIYAILMGPLAKPLATFTAKVPGMRDILALVYVVMLFAGLIFTVLGIIDLGKFGDGEGGLPGWFKQLTGGGDNGSKNTSKSNKKTADKTNDDGDSDGDGEKDKKDDVEPDPRIDAFIVQFENAIKRLSVASKQLGSSGAKILNERYLRRILPARNPAIPPTMPTYRRNFHIIFGGGPPPPRPGIIPEINNMLANFNTNFADIPRTKKQNKNFQSAMKRYKGALNRATIVPLKVAHHYARGLILARARLTVFRDTWKRP